MDKQQIQQLMMQANKQDANPLEQGMRKVQGPQKQSVDKSLGIGLGPMGYGGLGLAGVGGGLAAASAYSNNQPEANKGAQQAERKQYRRSNRKAFMQEVDNSPELKKLFTEGPLKFDSEGNIKLKQNGKAKLTPEMMNTAEKFKGAGKYRSFIYKNMQNAKNNTGIGNLKVYVDNVAGSAYKGLQRNSSEFTPKGTDKSMSQSYRGLRRHSGAGTGTNRGNFWSDPGGATQPETGTRVNAGGEADAGGVFGKAAKAVEQEGAGAMASKIGKKAGGYGKALGAAGLGLTLIDLLASDQ